MPTSPALSQADALEQELLRDQGRFSRFLVESAGSSLAPRLVARFGVRPVVTAGMLLATAGLALFTGFRPDAARIRPASSKTIRNGARLCSMSTGSRGTTASGGLPPPSADAASRAS